MQIFIIAATSIDGYIAQNSEQKSTNWTSGADKKIFVEKTKQAGVMIMGRTTYQTIGQALPKRLTVVMTKNNDLISDSLWPSLIQVQNSSGKVVFTDLEPQQIITKLTSLGYLKAAICGGSSIYTLFMRLGLTTKLYLTVEPVIFGLGVKLFNRDIFTKLKLISQKRLNDTGTILSEWNKI